MICFSPGPVDISIGEANVEGSVGFFTNSPQYKNVNFAKLVLTLPLEMNETNEVYNLEM